MGQARGQAKQFLGKAIQPLKILSCFVQFFEGEMQGFAVMGRQQEKPCLAS